jgi:hypothetical protein
MRISCTTAVDSLSCLRSLDPETLATVNLAVAAAGFYGTYQFVPVIDGTFIVESPTLTLQNGHHNAVCSPRIFTGVSFLTLPGNTTIGDQ